jgi:thioredoxin reductase
VPRHSAHTGYGLRDLRRLMTGPEYARYYARTAGTAGAEVRTGTTLTGWDPPRGRADSGQTDPGQTRRVGAVLTSPAGIETVHASAVLLATGCRERPRSARLVPGTRPAGVLTTGELQQRVYLHGERLPGRAVVVGAEHVSFSAMLTLAHAGAQVVALVTDQPRHQSLTAFRVGARLVWRVPVRTHAAVTEIVGTGRVEAIRVRDDRSGAVGTIACETVVFSADWIPDHEHARLAGARMDPGTRGPAVDTALRTTVPGVFAAGNLVHAAETADVAALGGRHAARQVAAFLAGLAASLPDRESAIPVTADSPLLWIAPNAVTVPGPVPARGRFVLRSAAHARVARLEVRQDGRLLHRARTRLLPGRSVRLAGGWIGRVDPAGGPVHVSVK